MTTYFPLVTPNFEATVPASFARNWEIFVRPRGGTESQQVQVYGDEDGATKLSQPLFTGPAGRIGEGEQFGWVKGAELPLDLWGRPKGRTDVAWQVLPEGDQALVVGGAVAGELAGKADLEAGKLKESQLPSSVVSVSGEKLILEADRTGVVPINAALQELLDKMRDVPKARLVIPPGIYKISRASGSAYAGVHVWNGTVEGAGDGSHLFLDPATAPSATRFYPLMIGDIETVVNGVTIRDLKFTANQSVIGGGSLMGPGARHDNPANIFIHSDNVLMERCFIYDTMIAFGCHKDNETVTGEAERLASQFRNWTIRDCFIEKTGNKAIEFAECIDGKMLNNEIREAFDGPQLLFFCRNGLIEGNWVEFTDTGINVAHGITDSIVRGNFVIAGSGVESGAAAQALQLRCEPVAEGVVVMSGIRILDNFIYNRQGSSLKRAFQFKNQGTGTSTNKYRDIHLRGNVFDGAVLLRDPTAPSKTEITDLWVTDNTFRGAGIDTVKQATCAVGAIRFARNKHEGAVVFKGSDCSFDRDAFLAGLTFNNESARNHITDGIEASAFTDEGTENLGSLADVRKLLAIGG
jgi:hypothetical protein